MGASIAERCVSETPFAVLDFETTGLNPGTDRVVEVSVMRMEPGKAPEMVLDTLINPQRLVAATEIHGITDTDVADAPRFQEVAGEVVKALSDAVLAAYNVYFDIRFLEYELSRAGVAESPPHLCLMYLRPMLDLGCRCRLGEACMAHGIEFSESHIAAQDVQASARLMEVYLGEMQRRDIRTFRDLAALRTYKFVRSFELAPFNADTASHLPRCARLASRGRRDGVSTATTPIEPLPSRQTANRALAIYWDALKAVVSDLMITDEELDHLKRTEEQLGLKPEQVRVLHARAFGSAISQFIDDQWLDERERRKLKRLHQCLSVLGWAPGE